MGVSINLKKEINSIRSISKITNAMELVATAKLKKAGRRIKDSKEYFAELYTIFNDIISKSESSIYQTPEQLDPERKTCYIVVNSNLGLCGGYNVNVNKLVRNEIKPQDLVIAIGAKAESYFRAHKHNIMRVIKDVDVNYSYDQAQEIASDILVGFNNQKYQEIKIAYTKFINNVTFEPTILQLLPIKKTKIDIRNKAVTEFEPNASTILDSAVPMYLNAIIFSTIAESQVSEQASRRLAMENATNNASDLLDKLSLEYNRKRQAAITQEISEIVAGASAQSNR